MGKKVWYEIYLFNPVDGYEEIVAKVMEANPKELEAYRNGKTKLLSFFMGQIMKLSCGKADPKIITQILKEKL